MHPPYHRGPRFFCNSAVSVHATVINQNEAWAPTLVVLILILEVAWLSLFSWLSERLTNFFLKIVFGTLETCYDASSYALFSLAGVFVLLYSNFFGGGQIAKKRDHLHSESWKNTMSKSQMKGLIWAKEKRAEEGHETLKRSLTNKLYLSLIRHVTIVNNHYIILFLTMYYIKKYVRV